GAAIKTKSPRRAFPTLTGPLPPAANFFANAAIAASRVGKRKSQAEAGLSNKESSAICRGVWPFYSKFPKGPHPAGRTTKFPPNYPKHAALNQAALTQGAEHVGVSNNSAARAHSLIATVRNPYGRCADHRAEFGRTRPDRLRVPELCVCH